MAELKAIDGMLVTELAAELRVPRVVALDSVPSALDVAHQIAAAGAAAGTIVVADEQTAGRGRLGRTWHSDGAGRGLWMTLIERPDDPAASEVLSLRIGLQAADALRPLARGAVGVKWPNDLQVEGRKLAGVLIETRWRSARPEWVAIGVGVNISDPTQLPHATGLADGASRLAALRALVPALRAAAAQRGPLTDAEMAEWTARDVARGRTCSEPAAGVVEGITPDGALLVRTAVGIATFRAGSLVLTS